MGGVVRTFDKLFGLGGYKQYSSINKTEREPMQMDADVVESLFPGISEKQKKSELQPHKFAGIAKKQKKGNYGSILSGGTQSAAPVETKSLLGG